MQMYDLEKLERKYPSGYYISFLWAEDLRKYLTQATNLLYWICFGQFSPI